MEQVEIVAHFQPLPWQMKPWADTHRVILLTGSAGGGKSRFAGEKLHGYCKRYAGTMALMLRKTRESMTNSTVLLMDRTVIANDSGVRHLSSKSRFEYVNGSILAYGGMKDEQQREQIRSIGQEGGVDIAWMEEAAKFTESDFNEVLARMRGKAAPWRQVILSTNPDAPTHWIYKRLIKGGKANTYYSGAMDNPHNPADYIETLATLTGVLGQRLRDGLWIQAVGAVYDGYDPALHLIDPFPIPSDWRKIRAIDFGYTNPFTCQWWALDGDGRMYLYREIYHTQRLVEDHAKQITELSVGEHVEATTADHDAEDRATLERYGVTTVAAEKSIRVGIQMVQKRLRKAGDGKPRLFIFRGALVECDRALGKAKKPTCTEDEFPAYVWPEGKDGKPYKEIPIDDNNHGMDAGRYAVMYLDGADAEVLIGFA